MVLGPRLPKGAGGTSGPLGVLLLDRHSLFLAALSQLLSEALPQSQIETTTDSDRAIEIISEQRIDLAFCEVRSGPVAGPDLVGQISQLSPKTRVVLLADPEDAPLLVASLSCGAVGFFTKDASPEEFVEGIEAVVAGHYVVGRRLVESNISRLSEPVARVPDLDRLSPAEKGVLMLVGQGKSIRAIAATRSISQKTVRNHLVSIYRKLDLRNRSEAALWSARAGLTDAASE